jgi:hypothetical protein
MLLPFAAQAGSFHPAHVPTQSLGVFGLAIVLLVADAAAARSRAVVAPPIAERHLWWVAVTLIALSAGLQFTHFLLMPRIPVLTLLFGGGSTQALREAASKTLPVPFFVIYLFQFSLVVLAPLIIAILVQLRRYWWLALYLALSAFYAVSTTARLPALLLAGLTGLLLFLRTGPLSKAVRRMVWGSALIAAAALLGPAATHPLGIFRYRVPEALWFDPEVARGLSPEQKSIFTLPDHSRRFFSLPNSVRRLGLYPQDQDIDEWLRISNYAAYRLLLVPSEVAHWWYVYFSEDSRRVGWRGLTPATRLDPEYRPPANELGRWAFLARHPGLFGPTIHAYASADADAYARWGLPGIVCVGLLIGAFRLVLSRLRTEVFLSDAMYFAALFVISYTLPMGSIFAALVPQGGGGFAVLLAILRLRARAYREVAF